MLTYYGFDGTQANKKLHSEFEIMEKYDGIATTSILDDKEGLILSLLYDKGSLFYNKTLIVDLRGPVEAIKTNHLVPGEYQFDVFNGEKKLVEKSLKVTIKAPQKLVVETKSFSHLPKHVDKKRGLEAFMDWNGAITKIVHGNTNQESFIKIHQRVEKWAEYTSVPQDYIILASSTKSIFFRKKHDQDKKIFWIKKGENASEPKEFPLTPAQLGCHSKGIAINSKYAFVLLGCSKAMNSMLEVIKFDLTDDKILKTYTKNVDFEVVDIKTDITEDTLLVACQEDEGNRVEISKFLTENTEEKP